MATKQKVSTGRKSSLEFLQSLDTADQTVQEIAIDTIEPDPHQPRQTWHSSDGIVPAEEQTALENLASDIKEQGVMQPIIVREIGSGKYMIIIGERRWRASKLAGRTTIPAIIRQDLTGVKVALAQLAENVQRENMSDLDTARFVKRMLEENSELQKRDLAQLLNKNPSYVSRMMAFIDPRWAHVVSTGIISFASVLEQFRALPETVQDKLVETAKERGSPIMAHEVHAAKRAEKEKDIGSTSLEPAAGPLDDFGKQFAEILEAGKDETYTRKPDAIIDTTNTIVDRGAEQVSGLPKTPASVKVPSGLLDIQEVKMSLGQLSKLLEMVPVDASVSVTLPLSSETIAEAIALLGGNVPEDPTWLGKSLLDSLR
ncbi:ParB/RepB/Spo0J family partition protein [Methylovorus glucosotrophus]|uniref:ParB-like partition protein n=1 Tax=Methylovorus glucosotrophus (strain SIP3-4) TaxID=582744 RepID=C6XER3_METGS|nr:ParB/RepB/Spo0J family partition protein [Methylovorus glucosotrophus]ACT52120.1 parB-like partition protein [Methylovorus glucosotrophus SIP3-4]